MSPLKFALLFTCLFAENVAHMTTVEQSSLHLESANVGQSVTLPCLCRDDVTVMCYWYKQTVGQKPKLVSTFYKHSNNGTFNDEFKDQRFSLGNGNRKYDLKISHLHISDSATYYCVGSNLYDFEFCNGTTVTVKGSGLNVQTLVHQSGGSVTLNCTVHTGTCNGEHSVYWFKQSEESHPGLIYTHGDMNDQCERKPNAQTHTCVYNLPMKDLNLSHAGTYYCAVASCGHILFGDETKLDIEDEEGTFALVYVLSAALAFTTVLVVLLALLVYKMSKRTCPSTESDVTLSAASTPNAVSCQDAENLHYAALKDPKGGRSRRQRSNTHSECVYSGVKQ